MKYILASASPRRKELLKYILPEFECIPADIEEVFPENLSVFDAPEYLAKIKAESLSRKYPDRIIIGSDTAVIINQTMLGKPKDRFDAEKMLKMLSGKTHAVVTGCAIIYGNKKYTFSEKTDVEFYELTDEEISDYISSGEPMDKAGAYGIQELGSRLVKKINGDFFTVMGLPVASLHRKLKSFEADL